MSYLELLPNEISIDILSYLPQSDLLSASSVSRRLNVVSQSLLYSAPVLINHNNISTSSTILFLRSLVSPRGNFLAACVHSVHVDLVGPGGFIRTNSKHNDYDNEEDENSGPTRPEQNDISLLAAAATRFGYSNYNNPGTQFALILFHLPRLHTLRITDERASYHYMHNESLPIHKLALGLQQLREFHCCLQRNGGGLTLGDLRVLLWLPHIKKIELRIFGPSPIDSNIVDAAPASSTVTDLRFAQSHLTQKSLEYILKIPAALDYFSYSAPSSRHHHLDIGHALQPLKMTLKHLTIRFLQVTKPIGSLHDWPALETLRCSLAVLLGKHPLEGTLSLVDALPTGLRQLNIQNETFWPIEAESEQVLELLRRKTVVLPVLETLRVVIRYADAPFAVQYTPSLEIACQDAGVKLVIDKSPYR